MFVRNVGEEDVEIGGITSGLAVRVGGRVEDFVFSGLGVFFEGDTVCVPVTVVSELVFGVEVASYEV